jgi:deoxyribodipyrimidine photo-lyase
MKMLLRQTRRIAASAIRHGRSDLQNPESQRKPLLDSDYVLYWMQLSRRVEENHALEYAIHKANALQLPIVVAFSLTPKYPEASLRHYAFMRQRLLKVRKQ